MQQGNIRDLIAEEYGDELLFLDPPEQFDSCIIGVGYRCGMEPVAIYSTLDVIKALCDGGLEYDEAVEHFEFNIAGAYVGERTPIFAAGIR